MLTLNRKIDFAIKLLQAIPQDGPIELSYSGGKDSDVILELAKMSGIPFEAIYKNTTIDPPGTIAHCKENGVTIMPPKQTFLELVRKKGMPSRFTRFCCEVLKEYKIHDRAIQGIRREESTARAQRYKEPEFCRTYRKGEKVRIYLPILEWTLEDVKTFITDRNIKLAPVYYTRGGANRLHQKVGLHRLPTCYGEQEAGAIQAIPRDAQGANEGAGRILPHAPGFRQRQAVRRRRIQEVCGRSIFQPHSERGARRWTF